MNGTSPVSTPSLEAPPANGFARWLATNEAKVICVFAAALLALNLATALYYPTCWMDEMMFSDPSICYVQGKGFTSTAWWQSRTLIWSGNVPLHAIVLIPWLKLVGISLVKARAFNYTVITATLVIFWLGVKRLNLIASAPMRVGMIVTVFMSYALATAYRSVRPDCLGILLCAIGLVAWSWKNRWRGNTVLFAIGFLAPMSGLQLCAYLGFLCVSAWLMERNRSLLRSGVVMTGVITGVIALFSYYHAHHLTGVQETVKQTREFREMALAGGVQKTLDPKTKALVITKRIFRDQFKDNAIMPALVALLFLACDRKVWSAPQTRFLLLFGLLSTMALVSALETFLHYLEYYHWMNYVLLALALFALLDRTWERLGWFRKSFILLLLAASITGGLPLRVALGMAMDQPAEYAQLEKSVADNVRSSDVVFSDFMGYFPAKVLATDVYTPPYLKVMTAEERQSVNVLILGPADFDSYREYFSKDGQRWKKVAEFTSMRGVLGRLVMRLLPHYTSQATNYGYSITILRREPAL